MKWRERWGVDTIESWKTPEVCKQFCPHGLSGFDKEGAPLIVVPFAGMDIWGMLHTVPSSDLIRVTIQALERYMNIAYEQSKTHGYQARQLNVLFDMTGFNLKQYLWRPGKIVD